MGVIMNYRHAALAAILVAAPVAAQSDGSHISTTAGPSAPARDTAAAVIAPAAAPSLAIASPPGSNAVLHAGTELPLRTLEELTTKEKQLRVGNHFRLETSEPVVVEGVTVIPAGSPAVGEITDVRNKGGWGKSGKFNARLLYLTVNGRQIRLSGGFDDKGSAGGTAAVAVSALVFAPAGFFMTGKSAKVASGTVVKGFIDEDVPLNLPAAAQSAVMTVAPAAPVAVPAVDAAPATAASAAPTVTKAAATR